MNGVDRANQLRKNYTAHRPYEHRIWRPLGYYILDVSAVNSYLLWKGDTVDSRKRGQRPFREALITTLLDTPYPPPLPPMPQPHTTHYWQRFEKRGFCIWCNKYMKELDLKRTINARPPLADIGNQGANREISALIASTQTTSTQAPLTLATRISKVYGGCRICSAYLCVKGACFKLYHSNRNHI
jgi:hypothetical protein